MSVVYSFALGKEIFAKSNLKGRGSCFSSHLKSQLPKLSLLNKGDSLDSWDLFFVVCRRVIKA